jgi:AraC-like DNA-binding protein
MEAFPARDFVLDMVWTVAGNQEITNLKDQKLTEKMKPALHPLIRKIEDFSLLNDFFRNADATIEDLAKELNVPSSHVTYLFKYHCKESFADFKKIIRIQDAIKLLKSGFHSSHTLESLATEVGFTSYPTFFNSFKSITGKSPQEYISNI